MHTQGGLATAHGGCCPEAGDAGRRAPALPKILR